MVTNVMAMRLNHYGNIEDDTLFIHMLVRIWR